MHRLLLALLLVTPALASCAQGPTVGADLEPVIHGTRETGYPEVVSIYWMNPADPAAGGALCSGTVIGPHVVMTAKHCVFQEPAARGGAYVAVPPSWYYVIEGSDINAPGPVHRVADVQTTPGSNVDQDVSEGNDIAFLLLPDSLTVTPRGYATTTPAAGTAMTVVGFGRTMTGTAVATDSGLKYSGPMMIRRTTPTQIQANGTSWTCQGDSGGPLIDPAGNVSGITSFGLDSTCVSSTSFFTNVAGWTSLIQTALAWMPACVPQPEICNGIDDDCNGMIDDGLGCAAIGAACTASSQCASTTCAMAGGSMVCTRVCFPDTGIDPCPTGTHCEPQSCGGGYCAAGAAGAGTSGATCTANTDCASGYCAVLQGRHLCGRQCWPSGGSGCTDGLSCDLGSGTDPLSDCGACIPLAQQMGPQGLGGPCTTDAECSSMHCTAAGQYCTEACTMESDCPSSWHCNGAFCAPGGLSGLGGGCSVAGDCLPAAPDCVEGACSIACTMGTTMCGDGFDCYSTAMGDHCLHMGNPLGGACTSSSDCRSNICLSNDTCSLLCDTAACPDGFHCVDAGGTHVCIAGSDAPPASNCGCTVVGVRSSPVAGLGILALLGIAVSRRRRAH